MTGAEFSGVDHDLLADYVGGALAGTRDEAVVAARIAGDPAWRAAHDELTAALTSVGADLATLGAVPEPMPADVLARLDAALASAVADPSAIEPSPAPTKPHLVPSRARAAPGRPLTAVPDGGVDRGPSRSTRPAGRRRRLRWAAPLAAAAGVLAFGWVGISYLTDRTQTSNDRAASSAADAGSALSAPESAYALPAGAQVLASGRDYLPSTLGAGAGQTMVAPVPKVGISEEAPALSPRKQPDAARSVGPVPPALERLRAADALQDCLHAIAGENGGGAVSVQTIDYARYSGNPALVVRFTAPNGSWVWASGPDCGTPGAGAAKLAAVQVR